jgi:LmbE family N-acetylglucosaminyl deacetylase
MEAEKFTPASVLVIMPHPDDIEFSAAGSLAKWIKAGAQVTYCLVTDGSAGSNDPQADLELLIEQRQAEQRAAAAILGVKEVIFLNYKDGELQPTLDLRRHLTRIIRQIKPERVITFDPSTYFSEEMGYINHPDHRACGEATLYAVFPSAETRPIFPELLAEGLQPHKVLDLYLVLSDKHNVYVDVTAEQELKLAALACHKSQLGPADVEMVAKWGQEAGALFGLGAAEVFRVLNFRPPAPQAEEASSQ